MKRLRSLSFYVSLILLACVALATAQPIAATQPVRVAAIGGINDGGFWGELARQFEQLSGIPVQTVATGNKDGVGELFRRGGIDLITVQSAEVLVDLAADGYVSDLRPWVRVPLILVGPADDPAGVKGSADAKTALGKLLATNSPFVVHASLGADQIVRQLMPAVDGKAIVLLNDHQKQVLQTASEKHAYTLIAASPFRSGKIPAGGLIELLGGDPALNRPMLLAIANPQKVTDARVAAAEKLSAFLRSPQTQRWIAAWRDSKSGEAPCYFPIAE